MKVHVTVFVFYIASAIAINYDAKTAGHGIKGLKVLCDTKEKLDIVLKFESHPDYDFLHTRSALVEVLVTGREIQRFRRILVKNNIEHEVFIENVPKAIHDAAVEQEYARFKHLDQSDSISLKYFPGYEEIKSYLEKLSKSRSDIVRLFSIGKSYEGRDIVGINISSGGSNKPILFIDAGIHAREWIAPTTALYAIKQLVENSTNRHIFKNIDIYVIPSLNPDGYEYSHQNESTRMWRKTRSRVPGSYCLGADPNRNFDIAWMSFGGSSDPCSITYAGSRPFSEPETAALRDFILDRKDRIKAYLTLHSYGSYFLHPWGHTKDLPKNEPQLRCVASEAKAKLFKLRGTEYVIGSSANVNAFTAGNSKDWVMGKAGIGVSYTMELPRGYGFLPPPSEIIPTGQESFEAIKVLASYVEGNICRN